MSKRRALMLRMGAQIRHAVTYLGRSEHNARALAAQGLIQLADVAAADLDQKFSATAVAEWRDRARFSAMAQATAATEWSRIGFPLVKLPARLAAALMLTDVPRDAMAHVRFPWRSFAVDVPVGLVVPDAYAIESGVSSNDCVCHVAVYPYERVESSGVDVLFQWEDTGSLQMFSVGSVEDMSSRDLLGVDGGTLGPVSSAIRRLVLGICVELSGYPPSRLVVGAAKIKRKHERRGAPDAWVFEIARDVKIDCREEVVAFLRGGDGATPKVQSFVRGHWKRQPCGPGGANRKWIHIEPHWRGPEDAPIAVRSHEFVDTRSEG